jgi:hypothetical protein
MKPGRILMAVLLAGALAWIATHTEASDWRYPKMLATELSKMPFRYFV